MITYEESLNFFNYDKETGIVYWKEKSSKYSKVEVGVECGYIKEHGKTFYKIIFFKGRFYLTHRIIWLMVYGEFPQAPREFIDHIDGDGLNNRIGNLRDVSSSENGHNKQMLSNNKSGYTGVCWNKARKKWEAYIAMNKKQICLGFFDSKEESALVRMLAENEYGLYTQRHGN